MINATIQINVVKTNESLTITHVVKTKDNIQVNEIVTEDIKKLIKEGWLVSYVGIIDMVEVAEE